MVRIKEILLPVMEVMWYVKMEEGSGMSKWKRETTSSQKESQQLLSSTRYLPRKRKVEDPRRRMQIEYRIEFCIHFKIAGSNTERHSVFTKRPVEAKAEYRIAFWIHFKITGSNT